jgi:hypothetical protein
MRRPSFAGMECTTKNTVAGYRIKLCQESTEESIPEDLRGDLPVQYPHKLECSTKSQILSFLVFSCLVLSCLVRSCQGLSSRFRSCRFVSNLEVAQHSPRASSHDPSINSIRCRAQAEHFCGLRSAIFLGPDSLSNVCARLAMHQLFCISWFLLTIAKRNCADSTWLEGPAKPPIRSSKPRLWQRR